MINPSIILKKRESSPIMDQLARGLLMHGDMNYQQAFQWAIIPPPLAPTEGTAGRLQKREREELRI